MTASYPGSAIHFTYKHDITDTVLADNVNVLYDEVIAIGNTVGLTPNVSGTWGSGSFDSTTLTWASVSARIQNLENGVFNAVNNRVSTAGGSTLTPGSTSVVGLVLKGVTSGTDVLQAQAPGSSTAITKISRDGILYYNNAVVATVSNTETLSNKTLTGSTIDGSANTVTNLSTSAVTVAGTGTNVKTYIDAKPSVFYQSTAPATGQKAGDLWIDSGSSIPTFDTTNFISVASASVTSGFGYRRINASTVAPTSSDGANGDVWLQYIP